VARVLPRSHIDKSTARNGDGGAGDPKDESVVSPGRNGALEVKLNPRFSTRFNCITGEDDDAAANLGCACVQEDFGAVAQRPRR
jgi:hypothetical protein